ncbi:MAG: hypothetical protein RIS70_812 [Planctomycetota bacterium]|jgi:hypothetical protein
MLHTLLENFRSPIVLAFALGVVARLVKSEFAFPRDVYAGLSIYLLFALGLKGGVELAHSDFATIVWPAIVTLLIGCITPVSSYVVLRRLGRFGVADAAGIAAHYGSVSAVTFIAAQQFAASQNLEVEGFLPTLLTLLESPGIHVALAIGAFQITREPATVGSGAGDAATGNVKARPLSEVLHEVLTARSMVLLVGGLVIGFAMGDAGYHSIAPFYDGLFKGALTLFILEMGMVAASRLGDLKNTGAFLLAFGILMPIVHGTLAVVLGHWAGLSEGGCLVLAAMAASASYIAAPPAVRMTLPQANPTYYLTASLAITFPFNILAGIPLYYQMAKWLAR